MPSIVPAMFWALRTHERMKMRVVARGARDDIRCPPGVTGRFADEARPTAARIADRRGAVTNLLPRGLRVNEQATFSTDLWGAARFRRTRRNHGTEPRALTA